MAKTHASFFWKFLLRKYVPDFIPIKEAWLKLILLIFGGFVEDCRSSFFITAHPIYIYSSENAVHI